MSTGFFKKGKGKHGGVNPPIAAKDIYLINSIKATNEIANKGADGVNKYISAKDIVQQGVDQILSGSGITWIEGWKYSNSSYSFVIRGIEYTNVITEYTLDPSHPTLDRYDIAVLTYDVNGEGIVKIKKGDLQVEGFAAIVPTATPGIEIYLATFPVKAGLAAPADITNMVIYSEDASVVDANGLTVIGNSSVSPYSGAICIKATDFTSIQSFNPQTGLATSIVQKFYIKQAVSFNPALLETFKLQIISDSGRWDNNGTIKLAFIKADNTVVGDYVIIDSRIANAAGNPFAFESRNFVWQTLTIPTLAFNANSADIVGIVVMKDDGRGTDTFRLDLISVQGGIVGNVNNALVTRTDQLLNKGADNTSTYVEHDEIATVATSGSYNDLIDKLVIVNDLLTGGITNILSAQQGVVLKSQIDAIYVLLGSDNLNLDTVQEIVDAIETIQISLGTILVNDLTTGGVTKALTAEMGKSLKGLIDTLTTAVNAKVSFPEAPIDGVARGRKDGTWVPIAGSSAPFLNELIPDTYLPSTTGNFILSGSFFTPTMTVVVEGHTINYKTFISSNKVLINLMTSAVEGTYDVTLNNGIEAVFPDRLAVINGTVYKPMVGDWNTITGNIDLSSIEEAKTLLYNSSGSAYWNQAFDTTKDYTINFELNPTSLGAFAGAGGSDTLILQLQNTAKTTVHFSVYIRNDGSLRIRTSSVLNPLAYSLILYNNTDVYTYNYQFRKIGSTMYFYANGVLKTTFSDVVAQDMVLKAVVSSWDIVNIRYIDLSDTSGTLQDVRTKTSELQNDGEDGTSPFATDVDVANALLTNIVDVATTTYSFLATNAKKKVVFSSATAVTATIPTNAVTAIPIGSRIEVTQSGNGVVTLVTTGLTVISASPLFLVKGQTVVLIKTAINTWSIEGNNFNSNLQFPLYPSTRDDGVNPTNKVLSTDASGNVKMYKQGVFPAPYIDIVVPDSTLPSTTGNFELYGSFFTPTMTVVFTGQTVNYIVFHTTNWITVNVTTGATEGLFSITLDNGLSKTFPNAYMVVLGTVFTPTSADWVQISGLTDFSEDGSLLLSSANTLGTVKTTTPNFIVNNSVNWEVSFRLSLSPIDSTPYINYDGTKQFIALIDATTGEEIYRFGIRHYVVGYRIYYTFLTQTTTIYDSFTTDTSSTSPVFGYVFKIRSIAGITKFYVNSSEVGQTLYNHVGDMNIKGVGSQLDWKSIKYVELA